MTSISSENSLPADSESVPGVSLEKRFFHRGTLLSFVLAFGILAVIVSQLRPDFGAIWGILRQSDPIPALLGFVVYYLTFPLRGLRWRLLLNNVGLRRSAGVPLPSSLGLAEIIFLGWFANCVVPAKLGDAYRSYLLKKNAQVSFSTTMGTVLAERIIDMVVVFALLTMAALALLGGGGRNTTLGILQAGLLMVLALTAGLGIMRGFGGHIQRLLPQRLRAVYLRFQEGTLGSFRRIPAVAGLTVVVWLMEAGRLLLVTQSLGLSLAFSFVLFVALANSLLTVIPFTPGGLGLVEAGVVGLLMFGTSKEMAFSAAMLDRTISYWSLIAFGFLLFLVSRKR